MTPVTGVRRRRGWAAPSGRSARVTARGKQHREEHRQVNWLRDVILGGQDGLARPTVRSSPTASASTWRGGCCGSWTATRSPVPRTQPAVSCRRLKAQAPALPPSPRCHTGGSRFSSAATSSSCAQSRRAARDPPRGAGRRSVAFRAWSRARRLSPGVIAARVRTLRWSSGCRDRNWFRPGTGASP